MQTHTTLQKHFSSFDHQVVKRYFSRTINLIDQLNEGVPHHSLGGCRLEQRKEFIRFKFGCYRLILKFENSNFVVKTFIHRKNLESFIKRRCS